MKSTSVNLGYGATHRRNDSDDDSAISVGYDHGDMEKQYLPRISRVPREYGWQSTENLTVKNAPKRAFLFVLPSFISRRFKNNQNKVRSHHGIPTLNGLRGLAALIVFNDHLTSNFDHSFLFGYGVNDRKTFPQWPLVRVIFSGASMASIFFVISGYVLSYRPLQHFHNGNLADGHRTIASSMFRRGFRLYVPTFITILCTAVASWAGLYDKSRTIIEMPGNPWGVIGQSPPHFQNLLHQLRDASSKFLPMFNVWSKADGLAYADNYDPNTWTIPQEFRNSLLALLGLTVVSRLNTSNRFLAHFVALAFTIYTQNQVLTLFLLGTFLADLDLLRKSRSRFLTWTKTRQSRPSFPITSPNSPLYPVLFILGLFVCSIPTYEWNTDPTFSSILSVYPFTTFKSFDQPAEWFRVPGAALVVWPAANSNYVAPLFSNAFAQYVGQIAFSLSLIHGPLIRMILHTVVPNIYAVTGNGTKEGQTTGWQTAASVLLGAVAVLPVTVWAADLFWRVVDLNVVVGARWLEERMSAREDDGCTSPKRWSE